MSTKVPNYDWNNWGHRFKAAAKKRGWTLAKLADRADAIATVGGLRHYTNGTRDIKLKDFFELCRQADVDAHDVLFGPYALTDARRKALAATVVQSLETAE